MLLKPHNRISWRKAQAVTHHMNTTHILPRKTTKLLYQATGDELKKFTTLVTVKQEISICVFNMLRCIDAGTTITQNG
jgi:hypothetical protein